jgi:phosphatidylglycerophosphate synthase
MRKIPEIYENPIDNIFLDICENFSLFFKNTGHTPNIITTYSLFFGILSIYYLYINNFKLFALFFIISYFFDCLDGHFARKYNMVTKFGDYYDHFTDSLKGILLMYVVFLKYKNVISFNLLIIFFIFSILTFLHIGCQQKIYNSKYENMKESIDNFQQLCKSEKWITTTRFFGSGTFIFLTIIGIFYLNSKLKLINKNQPSVDIN